MCPGDGGCVRAMSWPVPRDCPLTESTGRSRGPECDLEAVGDTRARRPTACRRRRTRCVRKAAATPGVCRIRSREIRALTATPGRSLHPAWGGVRRACSAGIRWQWQERPQGSAGSRRCSDERAFGLSVGHRPTDCGPRPADCRCAATDLKPWEEGRAGQAGSGVSRSCRPRRPIQSASRSFGPYARWRLPSTAVRASHSATRPGRRDAGATTASAMARTMAT